ncbi:hypothetical protein [Paludibacter jiangxiensis]|uniref:Uncharacterized protein n=1 Tax=Paludibacter jiangxiensis TaxID=681398 RepID=A0A171AUE8_9BACT|nr:hypothetical protein [Paludibacter jiangxiensis]GAT64288.1 hypothetical protein PJIAN_4838 [Paludibacter jiangxiensis]
MDFSGLNLERIERDAKHFHPDCLKTDEKSYLESYPIFVNYFKQITGEITKEHLIIAAHFVYGWMPTILTLNTGNSKKVLELLNRVRAGSLLKEDELKTIKECVNNSMVGTSKLLHFINPEVYAIWDSKVFFYIRRTKNETVDKIISTYGIEKEQNYRAYLKALQDIIQDIRFEDIYTDVLNKLNKLQLGNWAISKLRAAELIMFYTEKTRRTT